MKHKEDLPRKAPDESLLGKHLLLVIYPPTGTLKMFEKDRVAVVCAHSALILPPWFQAMATHLWMRQMPCREREKKKHLLH